MGARPEQCSCCPTCPDVDPLVCDIDTPPATNEHAAVYNLNTIDGKNWDVETFSGGGAGFTHSLSYPLVFVDSTGQRFDPLTAGAMRLDMTAAPSGPRWIAGLLFWPDPSVTTPDILSRYDGPVTSIGCLNAQLRWLRGTIENLGQDDELSHLFYGAAVRYDGELYLQPVSAVDYAERCWQTFHPLAGPPFATSPLSGRFRRPLQARDLSDDDITRLPDWPTGADIGFRPRDVLYRLDTAADPVLIIDDRPEDWLEKYEQFGWWIGLSDMRLDQKDGTAPPINLGRGAGNDKETAVTVALDNLCLAVHKDALYQTIRSKDLQRDPVYVHDYGRGRDVLVDDPLDTLPVFGAGPGEWFTQRYQEDVAPQSTAPASVDAGYLTWTEETPGFDGYRPIVLATPWTVPAGLANSSTWRLCAEWTYREINRNDRNYTGDTPPPAGNSTYRRQACGVGVPGLFGVEIFRDQWTNNYSVQCITPGPSPYWLETGYPANPPADWDGSYPGQEWPGGGGYYTDDGKWWGAKFITDAPVPFDGSRIAVVCKKSYEPLGSAGKYRVDIRVFIDGWEVEFPSLYSWSTGQTHQNGNNTHPHNRLSWLFTAERIYLTGQYGGAWQDLYVTHTP